MPVARVKVKIILNKDGDRCCRQKQKSACLWIVIIWNKQVFHISMLIDTLKDKPKMHVYMTLNTFAITKWYRNIKRRGIMYNEWKLL